MDINLLTVLCDIPDNYDDNLNLKKKIQEEILNISDMKNYTENINIVINQNLKKIFINFKNKTLAENFCKNIKLYNNKINFDMQNLQIYPYYKGFSSVKIDKISDEITYDVLYDYINNLKYIKYCFFIENLESILFAFKDDATNFLNGEHSLNNIVLKTTLLKYNDNLLNYEENNNVTITINNKENNDEEQIKKIHINKDYLEKTTIYICTENIDTITKTIENYSDTIKQNINILCDETNNQLSYQRYVHLKTMIDKIKTDTDLIKDYYKETIKFYNHKINQ